MRNTVLRRIPGTILLKDFRGCACHSHNGRLFSRVLLLTRCINLIAILGI
jgi:hypothetical protein